MTDGGYISLNGSLFKSGEATVSPENRAMMYGDGCFETLKCYQGRFLKWNEHFSRLQRGLKYLEMQSTVSSSVLKNEVREVLDANNLMAEEAMVRIQFWREGGRGYKISSQKTARMIQVSSYDRPKEPLDLITAKTRCIPSEALERKHKLSNGLNYIKAAQEAERQQKDDALMLTVDGFVSETTIANLFWMKDGIIYTPSEECDLLPGITRNLILSFLEESGSNFEIGKFEPRSFYDADSAFCTNSLIEILEVKSIDNHQFDSEHDFVMQIKDSFLKFREKALKK
ncbi:MAG: aminotransferase class IV [Gracilimonas sp.]|nr:aminotransferase class IV [Gracilimonas sp.]